MIFFSISSGLSPYFSFLTLFMLVAESKIIYVGEIFSFWAFIFDTLVLSSLIFCFAAKAFPSHIEVVNISTLF